MTPVMSCTADLIRPIAHRGLHDRSKGIVENTETAVCAAIESGYGIEVDIQSARNGAPVVFHDRRLHRLTQGEGHVADYSLSELKNIPMQETGDRILGLGELLEIVDGKTPLLVEVKSDWRGAGPFEDAIARAVRHYKGPIGIMSFNPNSVRAIGHMAPGIPKGLVAGGLGGRRGVPIPGRLKRLALRHLLSSVIARPDFIAYDIRALPRLAPIIARKFFDRPLFTWTVRTKAQEALATKWADAMIFEKLRPQADPMVYDHA